MAEYAEIIKDLQKGKYAPIYFLQGEEPFFIDNIIANIEANALDETQKSFNQYVLYGKEVGFTEIMNAARKFPMMGERQVVIVKEAQEMRDWKSENALKLLESYLENPLPSTILAIGYKYKSLDRRKKITKLIEKNAVFLNSKKIYDDKVPGWVKSYAQATGASISEKAVMILTENIGNNLQRLANEIDKLRLNIPEGQQIDEVAVQKYVGISKDYNTFELQKALSLKDEVKVYKIVDYFAANPSSNPIILVIANLFAYYSKLLLIHDNGAFDKNAVARTIGVNPFFANEYIQAARNYPLPVVLRNLTFIKDADLQSKGIGFAPMKDGEILKELIYKLLH